ncbi:cupin domain-containing protein [Schwartzia succinivorans]|jgi:mannose-6-phosphate isomerase-like protein (cupin superfamily)|uniref:Mannose-6-phosphate isomerase, cupin superfamily n=1 Tax=Schwartzia succinivorans DSM 10502 TaxID=1123243 RepID=A0A1M4SMK4_9FIRM|nr:hypothetical protein [Schwartzia succinivorans]SHE33441.1 hypothetical protein SAMN02745190_00187 [Schwartzia succinivorans DSM 10502]
MIREIRNKDALLAIIIPHTYHKPGISFLTSNELSQQMAYMQHPKGHEIAAHVHNPVHRSVVYTRETLVVRKGKLRVDFYDDNGNYIESHVIETGDVILLVSGGHGFKVLEDTEMIEIKQGPYTGEGDKTRFPSVSEAEIVMRE